MLDRNELRPGGYQTGGMVDPEPPNQRLDRTPGKTRRRCADARGRRSGPSCVSPGGPIALRSAALARLTVDGAGAPPPASPKGRHPLRGLPLFGIFIVDTTGGFAMTARVQKWGNSLALRLPKALADEFRLEQGSAVDLRVVGGKLVLEPHRPPQYRLEDLLKKVTKRNLHAEIKTGRPVGKEAL